MDLGTLTWTCHVCDDERPDRFISVLQVHSPHLHHDGTPLCTVNVRYCNDRAACHLAAPDVGNKMLPTIDWPSPPGDPIRSRWLLVPEHLRARRDCDACDRPADRIAATEALCDPCYRALAAEHRNEEDR
jgi:hypothetical protein